MKKKVVVFGLIGCLTLGSVSFAVDSSIKVKEPVPINVEIEVGKIKIETETIDVDMDDAEVEIKIPVIKGLKDKEYQKQLNDMIKSSAQKDLAEFKKEVEKLDIELKSEMKIGYEVKSEGDILSFVINSYFYTGGANGISRKDYYNIDVNKNETIKLADLFKENSDYKTIINDEINKQIKEQMTTDEKVYFEGEEGFKTIDDNQSFYIDKEGNLVITFKMYEIAPRCMGHPEFKIQKDSIVDILRDEEITNFDKVIINDKEINLKSSMFKSEKGTVMMPLKEVVKVLGFEVKWDGKNNVANINKDAVSAGAYIDKNQYYFSKALVQLEEGAKLIKGTTFVPVSFIDEVIKGEKTVDVNGMLNIKY